MTAGAGETQVWAIRESAPWDEAVMLSVLDDRERERSLSFVHERDRSLYVTAHVALRLLLAALLGAPAYDIRFGREPCTRCGGPHGRPVLSGHAHGPYFSLTHCAGLSLVALAPAPVGVDAERVPGREAMELCLTRLHPEERREVLATPADRRPLTFCRLWARKEAYLKARGTGLNRPLDQDYLGDGHRRARPVGWTVRNLSCGPQDTTHAAALAVPAGVRVPLVPREFDWPAFEAALRPGPDAPAPGAC